MSLKKGILRNVPKSRKDKRMNEDRLINPGLEDVGEERLENTLRPQTLDEYIGQDKVRRYIENQQKKEEKHWTMFYYMDLRDLEKLHFQI